MAKVRLMDDLKRTLARLPASSAVPRTVSEAPKVVACDAGRRAVVPHREQPDERFAVFNQPMVGIAHIALDGRFLRVNQALCNLVGYSEPELLARTSMDIAHPDDPASWGASILQLLASESHAIQPSRETRYVRKDGASVWVTTSLSLVRKPCGDPDYLVAMVQDTSVRKATEDRLHAAFEQ